MYPHSLFWTLTMIPDCSTRLTNSPCLAGLAVTQSGLTVQSSVTAVTDTCVTSQSHCHTLPMVTAAHSYTQKQHIYSIILTGHVYVNSSITVSSQPLWLSHNICLKLYPNIQYPAANYSGPCILRPPIEPAKYGLKLQVVLK